jgi:hypothetical protein
MGLEIHGDVAFSTRNSAFIVAMGLDDYGPEIQKPSSAPVKNNDFEQTLWSPWGKNNMMPKYIADDVENCGVLAAGLDAKARIATGKGPQPFLLDNITSDGKEELNHVSDSEINNWFEMNDGFEHSYHSTYDHLTYGLNGGSFVLNRGCKKIYRLARHDAYEIRIEKRSKQTKKSENIYLSASWENALATYDKELQARIALLEEGNEYNDLVERIKSNKKQLEYAFLSRTLRNGRQYYPMPTYRSNRAWIKIARSVPALKIALFKNSITIKYMVTIHPKFWESKYGQVKWTAYTVEQKQKRMDEYYLKLDNWLAGEDNGYKSIFTGGFSDPSSGEWVPHIKIEAVDDKIKDGKYLPESGAANYETLFSLMINPALIGAGSSGDKAYGDTSAGSNVRESFLIQLMITEPDRRRNTAIYNVVKRFNGWNRLETPKLITSGTGPTATSRTVTPRLVFRYPSGLLTTLDTGKSTKPENL